jgi:hypothetical protein
MNPRIRAWLCSLWLVALIAPGLAMAQSCTQRGRVTTEAPVYQTLPRYVTGVGWQGNRSDTLGKDVSIMVCVHHRSVDFGLGSRDWSQVAYRPNPKAAWRFGWIMREQWQEAQASGAAKGPVAWHDQGDVTLMPAMYVSPSPANSATEAAPEAAPDPNAPTAPAAPQDDPSAAVSSAAVPSVPIAPTVPGAAADTPPVAAPLGDQALLYGPLFIAMILGMLAKAIFDALDEHRPSWRDHLRHGAMAIVVSPMVFLGFITAGQFSGNSQTFLVLALFAFQNGFFWQTVLTRNGPVKDKAPETHATASAPSKP